MKGKKWSEERAQEGNGEFVEGGEGCGLPKVTPVCVCVCVCVLGEGGRGREVEEAAEVTD